MADRALRGMGLGSKSFEDEEGVEMAERQQIGFDCQNGHHFELTFSTEAEIAEHGILNAELQSINEVHGRINGEGLRYVSHILC